MKRLKTRKLTFTIHEGGDEDLQKIGEGGAYVVAIQRRVCFVVAA